MEIVPEYGYLLEDVPRSVFCFQDAINESKLHSLWYGSSRWVKIREYRGMEILYLAINQP